MRIKEVLRPVDDNGETNPVSIIVILTAVIIIIISVVHIIKNFTAHLTVIDNLPQYATKMVESARDGIYENLYDVIDENLAGDRKVPKKGALIRDGSYEQELPEGSENIYFSTFIVDIESIRQSYHIQLYWPDIKNIGQYESNLMITCVEGDDAIYEDFDCKNPAPMFPGEAQARRIDAYLPYIKYDANGSPLYQVVLYNGWIMISLQTCGDEKLTAQYRKEVDDWLRNTHIDLERYKDKINYKVTCDRSF